MARKLTIRRGLKAELPTLDIGELGYAIDTEELFIGSEQGNVLFAKKSELQTLQDQIDSIKNSDVYKRLGISANGLLTIDGIEQLTGGGNGDMTLVVKDYFEGSTNITKTYNDNMVGFSISNDAGVAGGTLSFTINEITIPVKATESYEANFLPFKTVTINTTVPYRATVSIPYGATFDTIAPLNVTGLTATNITTSDLTLTWVASTSSDVAGYDVYQGTNLLTTITQNTYNITGLTPSNSYSFTIKARDNSGNVANGISLTVLTLADTTAPNNVTNLVASNVLATSVTLSWSTSTSSDTTGYEIYNGATLLTSVTGTTYNVSGLTSNTNYTFTVKAKDGFNNLATGTSVSVTTTNVDTTAPFDVTGLASGTSTINSIPIGWTLSSSSDVANYEVAYSTNGGTNWTIASSLINSSSTSYTITGLTSGTTYTIRVVAIDTSGNRSNGATVVKATAAAVNYTLSASPSSGTYNATQNVTLSASPAGATIYYTTNTSTPTTSSSVYISPIAVSANTTIKFFAQDGNGNATGVQTATYTIDTVAPTVTISPVAGTYNSIQTVTITSNETSTIYYTVDNTTPTISSNVYSAPISVSVTETIKYLVVDTAGNQTTGSALYTIDTLAPDPVTTLTVGTVTSNSIPVTWTAPTAVDVSKYEVAYSSDGGTNYTLATSSLSTPATSYTVTGLTASTTYTIRVVAIDGAGNRSTPTTVSTTTGISAIIVSSTFDGANSTTTLGTSNTGQPWTSLTGTWGVSNNKAYLVSGTSNNIAYVDAGKVDVSVSTDITWGNSGGLALRVVDANNFILLRINTTAVQLYKLVTGTATLLKSYNFTPVSGQIYNLRADLRGSTITCYLNNAQIFEGYCTAFDTATKYGFKQNATTTDLYDNFTVQSIPSTATVASGYAVYDSFDRADSTTTLGVADTGQSWTPLVGTWGISANRAYQVTNTTGGALASAVIESGKSDAEISVVFNEYVEYGLIFRATDANNYLFVRYSSTSAEWQMFKTVSGTSTKIGNLAATVTDGTPFKLKVITSQTSLQFFVDDVSQFTVTDSFNQTATKHGIRGATTAASCYYDNFTIK